MSPIRTTVGLFHEAAAAQVAVEQLLAAGFAPAAIHVATAATLRAQHMAVPAPESATESFAHGIVQFFMEVFAGDYDDAWTHARATHPASAVVTVQATSPGGAERARALLDTYGAADVYKQAAPATATGAAGPGIDLAGDLAHLRDRPGLDANGLTTH